MYMLIINKQEHLNKKVLQEVLGENFTLAPVLMVN